MPRRSPTALLEPLRTFALLGTCLLYAATLLVNGVAAQQSRPTDALEVLQIRPNVHVIAGAGGNITVQSGKEGVIVVNGGRSGTSAQVLAAIQRITSEPIRYVIDTNGDAENVGGNEALARAGQWFTSGPAGGLGGSLRLFIGNAAGAASIIATERVSLRMAAPSAGDPTYPEAAWPSETFPNRKKPLRLNDEAIEIVAFPAAHTDGDLVVFFHGSDVIAAGDLIDMTRFPVIDTAHHGSIQGLLDALNELKDMAIPSLPLVWKDGGTLVVPAHGRIIEKDDVVQYRDMVTIVRDVVKAMMARGMSVDQIVAAQPAGGYAPRYGKSPGAADAFVRSVYTSLTSTR